MFNLLKKEAEKMLKQQMGGGSSSSHQQQAPPQYNQQAYAQPYGQPMYAPPPAQPTVLPFSGTAQPPSQAMSPMSPMAMSPSGRGKRKALLIGINYFGQQGQLGGCINDVANIQNWLFANFPQFNPSNGGEIVVLTDIPNQKPDFVPTKRNIINAMHWLVSGAAPGDSFFFHYSGHGGNKKDTDGDEADGYDETICPVDFRSAGDIVDDEMHAIMLKNLPQGCNFTAIFDSCHSGSALDLPYTYKIDGNLQLQEIDNMKVLQEHAMAGAKAYLTGNKKAAISAAMGIAKTLMNGGGDNGKKAAEKQKQIRTTLANVVQFSGCRDEQTSADTQVCGMATGALSWAFTEVFKGLQGRPISYLDLLKQMRGLLSQKYSQVPQMSAGYHMDMNRQFVV